jgi:bifunctional non-homologous end joining protein LigD
MSDPLEKYRKKRNPGGTNEPFGAEHTVRSDLGGGRFVIHQHAATRMHYDLRLEIGGTLQSFAVPKGITLDPIEKHLAVHTEDHPIEYLRFEDVIPEGNYGAGAMIIWDTGTFTFLEANGTDSLARGKLDFVLSGFKAKGRFALIATGRRKAAQGLAGTSGKAAEWLLIKKNDRFAVTGKNLAELYPRSVVSGLSTTDLKRKRELGQAWEQAALDLVAQHPPSKKQRPLSEALPMVVKHGQVPHRSAQYLYELKLDGVRILAHKQKNEVSLSYRSGISCTRSYSDIARCLEHLPVSEALIDGEIVTFDEAGRPNFGLLAPRIAAKRPGEIQQAQAKVPVVFFAFDLLQLGTADLRQVPLERRKELLGQLLPGNGFIRTLDHIVDHGDALWTLVEQQQLEGMVAKRLGTPYTPGPEPSGHWIKLKRAVDEDYAVMGYSQGERGALKAPLVALYGPNGWVYQGRVGTGFSNRDRIHLVKTLRELATHGPCCAVPDDVQATFVEPKLVIKVKHQGRSNAGHLRAASFQGIHEAKAAQDCRLDEFDQAVPVDPDENHILKGALISPPAEDLSRRSAPRANPGRVHLTNLDKVYFPEDGYTKGNLIDYYAEIAPVMLPHLQGRPVVLVRYPDGIAGKNFYQWRAPEKSPPWLRTFELYDEEKQRERGSNKSAFIVDSVDALLHIANLGCIPLHVIAGRETSPSHCDFLTIDFDLGERPLADGVRLALSLREILDELGLDGFPKTSGQRGLHVLVALGPGIGFESAKIMCELLGRIVLTRHADISTMQRRIDKRGDKVYIDTGQTGRSRTIVAPYSVRAYPGARVSTPLSWSEVHLALDPAQFTIETVPDRVKLRGDPMEGLLHSRPDLNSVMTRLARWT